MSRTALVTGGAGYVGGHVVLALLDAGWRVAVLDDLSTGRAETLPAGAALTVGDIGDAHLLDRLLGAALPDALIHVAGLSSAPESIAQPMRYHHVNAVRTGVLLAACARAGVRRVLFSSSAAVYGVPATPRVAEDAPTVPINPYGASKLAAERIIADAAAAHGLAATALRYFNVAGADGRAGAAFGAGADSLMRVALEAADGRRDHVPVYGLDHPTPDGSGVRDYIHAVDLASAHLAALDAPAAPGRMEVLNVGYGHGRSVLELLDAVERASGVRLERRAVGRRDGDPSEVVADNARLLARTHWRPRHDDLDAMAASAWAKARGG